LFVAAPHDILENVWIFTEIADAWDRLREEDDRFLDQQFLSWTQYALAHADDPEWYSSLRNAAIYTGVGLGYATWTLSTTIATGFIDTLRLGDGVMEGGWGYGKDALRLLMVAGPLLRVGRFGLAQLASVDAFPTTGTCAYVAAAKALRMTGVKHFATIDDLAKAAGVVAPNFPGVSSIGKVVVPYIQKLGGVARVIKGTAPAGGVEKALAAAVAANPSGIIIFVVRWTSGGAGVGHAMIAANVGGKVVILDRTGKVVTSLGKLPYKDIATATLDEMVLLENATAATAMEALGVTAAALNAVLHAPEPSGASNGGNANGGSGGTANSGNANSDGSAGSGGASHAPPAEEPLPPLDIGALVRKVGLEVRSVPMRREIGLGLESSFVRPPTSFLRPEADSITDTTCYDDVRPPQLLEGIRVTVPRRWCKSVTVEYKVYVVEPGDYLAKISKAIYGSEKWWRVLYQANRAKLGANPHDPRALRVGMQLEVPLSWSSEVWDEALPARP
jgi:nucleoid-associated protein YgaU